MKTTVGLLRGALTKIAPAVSSRSQIPILGFTLFAGETVSSTNLDIQIESDLIGCEGINAALHLAPMRAAIGGLGDDVEVSIIKSGTKARLSFGRSSYDISTLPIEDFPTLNVIAGSQNQAPLGFLQDMEFVGPYVAGRHSNPAVTGLFIDANCIVGLDGHRMAYVESETGCAHKMIIHPSTITAMKPLGHIVGMATSETMAQFHFDGAVMRSKVVGGNFPDWKRIVDAGQVLHSFKLDPLSLATVVKRLASFSPERPIRLFSRYGQVYAGVVGKDGFMACEIVTDSFDGADDFQITLASEYLAEALSGFGKDTPCSISQKKAGPVFHIGDKARGAIVFSIADAYHDIESMIALCGK